MAQPNHWAFIHSRLRHLTVPSVLPTERQLMDPSVFFGEPLAKKEMLKKEEISVADEELQLATALSLSIESKQSPREKKEKREMEEAIRASLEKPKHTNGVEDKPANIKPAKASRKGKPKAKLVWNWSWKSDLSGDENFESTWTSYSAKNQHKINQDYSNGLEESILDSGYTIRFDDLVQYKASDPSKVRPVRRVKDYCGVVKKQEKKSKTPATPRPSKNPPANDKKAAPRSHKRPVSSTPDTKPSATLTGTPATTPGNPTPESQTKKRKWFGYR
eukprot:1377107-Amorphochlora_amoeboformis.AAC.3